MCNPWCAARDPPASMQKLSKYIARELELHSRLSHPFVIGFKRVFYTEDHLVFVLEYASEGSVAKYMWPADYATRKLLAMYFFQQLIAAVGYCHRHNLVHRDLKHENCLLHMVTLPSGSRFMALKIADFGMCKAGVHSDPKTRVGTIPYMSPVRTSRLFFLQLIGTRCCHPLLLWLQCLSTCAQPCVLVARLSTLRTCSKFCGENGSRALAKGLARRQTCTRAACTCTRCSSSGTPLMARTPPPCLRTSRTVQ